jgi:hypothetical protein
MADVKHAAAGVQQFLIEPMRKRSGSLFLLQLAQLVTDRGRGRYDDLMCRALTAVRPKIDLPGSRYMSDEAIANSLNALRQRGWDILPWQVEGADIAEIRRFAFMTPAYTADPSEHIIVEEGNIPKKDGRYVWRMSELIRVAAVQKLITDGAMHRIAQDYLRCRPLLTSIILWLDPPYDKPIHAHQYHYDNDGPSFLKFFVYVTDIDETGAHSFIQGTHGHRKPPQFGRSGIYDRDALLQFYGGENEKVFTGPAGMILAEDTAGFHKGTTPSKGYRMLLQFQFTSLNHPLEEEFVCGVDKVRIEGVDRGIRRIASKFVA